MSDVPNLDNVVVLPVKRYVRFYRTILNVIFVVSKQGARI